MDKKSSAQRITRPSRQKKRRFHGNRFTIQKDTSFASASAAKLSKSNNEESLPYSYRGLLAPVFTAFHDDEECTINVNIIPEYAELLASKGINGILVNGTTGEGPSLSVKERKILAETWADAVKTTKQHLMIQIGGAPLPDVIALAKHAESIKVDSILCLPDLYFKPNSVQELINYLKTVGDAAPNTPLLYYHIPMFSNVDLNMAEFLKCIGNQIPSFAGLKFTSTNLVEGAQALCVDSKKYAIFLGCDQLMSAACVLGLDSFIATSMNMLPESVVQILRNSKDGNFLKAREEQERLSKAVTAISQFGNWVVTMKTAMNLLTTLNVGQPRAPLKPLPQEAAAAMARDLVALGYKIQN